jgi:NAD-dependent deacetylase
MAHYASQLTAAAEALSSARYAIALVGAGISVESGIRPFRGKGGLWTEKGEPPMDGYRRFMEDPAAGWAAMLARRDANDEFSRSISEAVPNEGHLAMAELETMGVLKHTITQNIDNLHVVAGQRAVTEIHGNRTKLRCVMCEARWLFEDVDLTRLPPSCDRCGGIIKSDTVMFGEGIPRYALLECYAHAERADAVLIVGTSATVVPAAYFPEMVLERGGAVVEVNTDDTPFTPHAAAVLRGPAGELLPQLVRAVRAARGPR